MIDQPAPQPRRDSFGVPWCDNGCPLFEMGGYCAMLNKKMHLEVCEPQARADAAERQRYQRDHDAAMRILAAAASTAEIEVARWPTLPELAERVTRDLAILRVALGAAQAEGARLRRENQGMLTVLCDLSCYADAFCFCTERTTSCDGECRDLQTILAEHGVTHPRLTGTPGDAPEVST